MTGTEKSGGGKRPDLLTVSGITKAYPGVIANSDVSFAIGEGEIHALLGENGAGKSTLVKMIYGLIRPDQGQMTLRGATYAPSKPAEARRLGVEAEFYQSNHEGDLVTAIQQAYGRMDGIVINAGAYTHTSIAILDALKAVSVPAAEVHISDVAKREDFRQVSYLGMACCCKFAGEGKQGYVHAMEKLIEIIRNKNT